MHEARLYHTGENKEVICDLCSHGCHIKEGKRGTCRVRENHNGTLSTLVYGRLVAENIDPIEKKPLFHLLPGSRSYSISTVGCNFRCLHCQNYQISQYPRLNNGEITGHHSSPAEVVAAAERTGCRSISHTYVEPTIFYEFAYDCCALAHDKGIKNVFVSNGYMSAATTRQLAPLLDAINIDIKAFTEKFYKEVCGARLQPVLETVRLMRELGVWVEVTTLIIPGWNDSDGELGNIARFIREVDPAMPWHVTAFYPTYQMTDREPTPVATLRRAREIGLAEGLRFVYEGNIPGEGGENTYCPACGKEVISRFGYMIRGNILAEGHCPSCGEKIEGIWW
ncbi:MAG: AmmeMemoRadiSam system radical SAM enzyme [Thermodesulfobacteriota bacterium]